MEQRSNKYREIVRILGSIEQQKPRKRNGKKFTEIENIGVIEFKINRAKGLVIINNIYFDNNQPKNTNNNEWQLLNNTKNFGFVVVRSSCGRFFNYMNTETNKIVMQSYKFTSATPPRKGGREFSDYDDSENVIWGEVELNNKKQILILYPEVDFVLYENIEKAVKMFLAEQSRMKILDLMNRVTNFRG